MKRVIPRERYVDWNFIVRVRFEDSLCHTVRAVCGLKCQSIRPCHKRRKSYRASGMWIEIWHFLKRCEYILVIPCERYVDWNNNPKVYRLAAPVIPCERYVDWNYIVENLCVRNESHIARAVCGLKWSPPEGYPSPVVSYRTSGMWIEISSLSRDAAQAAYVIPRERYVDWNC